MRKVQRKKKVEVTSCLPQILFLAARVQVPSHQIWFIPFLKVIRQIEKCTRLQELSKVYYAPIRPLECFGLRECKNQVWPP
ncbi:hypothetical protein CMV_027387 [Castanea mollissima]|uniref:Uncharacterized protein n=1 Tax=Castanea mollissima TaxID=60419 RepID=A0A8J4QI61_9ROSI|nr:hypothetical protein CMV_027387 [Castanea mollissima]